MNQNDKEPDLDQAAIDTAIAANIEANAMQAVFKDEAVMVELLERELVHWMEVPERYRDQFDAMFKDEDYDFVTQDQFRTFYNSLI